MALGSVAGPDEVAERYRPRAVVEPKTLGAQRESSRARWLEARSRAARTIPELSGIEF